MIRMAKVYWIGRHTTRPELGAPVSKVHAAGLSLLKSLGWEQVINDTHETPVFAFTTRKGANYPAGQLGLPTVRQLPQCNTACLDDKRRMQQHLCAAGYQQLLPPSWDNLEDFQAWLHTVGPIATAEQLRSDLETGTQLLPAAHSSDTTRSTCADGVAVSSHATSDRESVTLGMLPAGTYFIKHRSGVKGQAVYPVHNAQHLLELQRKLQRSSVDFVVQQEVPPMLLEGCKFILRVHVLITVHPLRVHVHEDAIVIKHAVEYRPCSSDAAVHVSSKGSMHPKPELLTSIPELHAFLWPLIQQLVTGTICAVDRHMQPDHIDPAAVLYQLFGFDCMVSTTGTVLPLEVNSYPAIASGTMADVDVCVYSRLLQDMLKLLVLLITDKVKPEAAGFGSQSFSSEQSNCNTALQFAGPTRA